MRSIALLAVFFCTGCRDGGERFIPVSGKVSIEGKPLIVGSVSFRPDAAKGNPSQHHPTGSIDPSGNFELYTIGKKGAPPGWYKVVVFADANAQSKQTAAHPLPPRWLVNTRYLTEQTSDLSIEVTASATQYDLKLNK